MILPCRGSEAASSPRDPCHRQLIREVRNPCGGEAAVPVPSAPGKGLAHAHKLLRPQWKCSWELSTHVSPEMDWVFTCCPVDNDFQWVLTMLENTCAIKQVEKVAVQQHGCWCLLMQSHTASSDRSALRTARARRVFSQQWQQRRHNSSNECAKRGREDGWLVCDCSSWEVTDVCPSAFS